jgi:hypothetical protein
MLFSKQFQPSMLDCFVQPWDQFRACPTAHCSQSFVGYMGTIGWVLQWQFRTDIHTRALPLLKFA